MPSRKKPCPSCGTVRTVHNYAPDVLCRTCTRAAKTGPSPVDALPAGAWRLNPFRRRLEYVPQPQREGASS